MDERIVLSAHTRRALDAVRRRGIGLESFRLDGSLASEAEAVRSCFHSANRLHECAVLSERLVAERGGERTLGLALSRKLLAPRDATCASARHRALQPA